MTDLLPNPTYYTLPELVMQRVNCEAFGADTSGIDYEIALMVESMSMDDRTSGRCADRITMSQARDILDERNKRFFDQDLTS